MSITSDFTVFVIRRIPFLQRGSILYDNRRKMFGVCLEFVGNSTDDKEIEVCWQNISLEKLTEDERKKADVDVLGLRTDSSSLETFTLVKKLSPDSTDNTCPIMLEGIRKAFSNLELDLRVMSDIFSELKSKGIVK